MSKKLGIQLYRLLEGPFSGSRTRKNRNTGTNLECSELAAPGCAWFDLEQCLVDGHGWLVVTNYEDICALDCDAGMKKFHSKVGFGFEEAEHVDLVDGWASVVRSVVCHRECAKAAACCTMQTVEIAICSDIRVYLNIHVSAYIQEAYD